MTGPLVDAEGFPRNDIDIYQVRQARQTIICLQNDHKELMNQIQTMLNQYHAEIATTDPELVNRASALDLKEDERGSGGANITPLDTRVLVLVNLVSPNSPAEEAVSRKKSHRNINYIRLIIYAIYRAFVLATRLCDSVRLMATILHIVWLKLAKLYATCKTKMFNWRSNGIISCSTWCWYPRRGAVVDYLVAILYCPLSRWNISTQT